MKTVIRVQFQKTFKWMKRIQIIRKHEAAEQLEFDMESIMPSTSTENDQSINFIGTGWDAKPPNKIKTDGKELKMMRNFKIQSGLYPRCQLLFSLNAQECYFYKHRNGIETAWKELNKMKIFKIQSGLYPWCEMLFRLYTRELHSLQPDNKIEEDE